MLQVSLSPQSEELVRQMVGSGRYHDAEQVIAEALLILEEHEQLVSLRAAVAIGDAQIERGEVTPLTPELFEEIKRNATRMAQEGHTPDPDVCP